MNPLRPPALLARHRVESRILLLFVGLLAAVLVLAKAGSEVVEGDMLAIDRALLLALRTAADPAVPAGPQWLTEAMIDVTALGGVSVLWLISCAAVGLLLVERKPAIAVYTALAIGGGALLEVLLKQVYMRARPEIVAHLVETDSPSFPSGHAMNSAIVYLTLAVLLARTVQDRAVRAYLVCVAIALTVLIGFSRVYLGVHWPTDVIAGWTLGGVWAAGCSLLAKRLQAHRTLERG